MSSYLLTFYSLFNLIGVMFLSIYRNFKGNVVLTLFFLLLNQHNGKVANYLNCFNKTHTRLFL